MICLKVRYEDIENFQPSISSFSFNNVFILFDFKFSSALTSIGYTFPNWTTKSISFVEFSLL